MKTKIEMPQRVKDMIGETFTFSGGIFNRKIDMAPTEMKVLDCRWSQYYITNTNKHNGKIELSHPAVELLVKNEEMSFH